MNHNALIDNANTGVSAPIWGLFNLTLDEKKMVLTITIPVVSAPIWGLFNLTLSLKQ